MANIVDALVVTLGLDSRDYQRGSRQARDDIKRTREEAGSAARTMEADGKRAASYFRSMRNEVAGLFLAFAGANGLKDFATQILAGDAATGRLAANLGVATEELGAWEGAIKRVGGQASDIDQTFRTLTSAFQNYRLTGTTGNDADFQGLGVQLADLQSPQTALMKIADARDRMSQVEFGARLGRIGLSESTITLLSRGRQGVAALVDEQRKIAPITERDAKAAQEFESQLAKLSSIIRGIARPQLTGLVEELSAFLDKGEATGAVVPIMTGVLGAVAIAAGVAYAPFFALAGVLAVVAKGFMDAEGGARRWARTQEMWERLKAGDISGAAGLAKDNVSDFFTGSGGLSRPDAVSSDWFQRAGGKGGAGSGSIINRLVGSGFSREQARGIDAGISAESGRNPNALNQSSGAFGIGQWLGPRKTELFRRYGRNPTLDQQLEFLIWELKGGDQGGAAVRNQSTAAGTLDAYIRKFMRPAAGAETMGDLRRGMAVLGGGAPVGLAASGGGGGAVSQTTSVGQVTIYTPATDADGIARDMRGALAKRGLVVQANTGLGG